MTGGKRNKYVTLLLISVHVPLETLFIKHVIFLLKFGLVEHS